MTRNWFLSASALALLSLAACQQTREPVVRPRPVVARDAGVMAGPDAAPSAGPTGSLEGTVSLTAPIPPSRPVAIDRDVARMRGCSDAARDYYGRLFGVTEAGLLPEAIVTVDARTTTRLAVRRRYAFFHDCSITPRVLAMSLGDELFLRAETDEHHLAKVDGMGSTIAQMLQRGEDQQKFIQHPGRYIIHSVNFPNWMQSPLVVTPNSFYDQTDREGHFRIEHLPAGTYTAHAWFPGATPANITVTIRPGETTQQVFSITPLPADQIRPNQPEQVDAGPVIP